MNLTYEQAKQARTDGKQVEFYCSCNKEWIAWNGRCNHPPHFQFRLADPYAELKAAHADGKVIQEDDNGGKDWWDLENPKWIRPADHYRVKPDAPTFAPGYYRMRNGEKMRIYEVYEKRIDGVTEFKPGWTPRIWNRDGTYRTCSNQNRPHDYDVIAPWTDEPPPYDNWDKVPAWHRWIFRNAGGIWESTDSKTTPFTSPYREIWVHQGISLQIPPDCAPTNFTGTWEQSLQKRPI